MQARAELLRELTEARGAPGFESFVRDVAIRAVADRDEARRDVGLAGDTPGMRPDEAQARLGGGPVAPLHDGSLIPNPRLRDLVADTAAREGIPFQYDLIPGGGNDGGRFQQFGHGVPALGLGIPARYIRGATSVISPVDFDHAVNLLTAVVQRLDTDTVRGLLS